MSGAAPEPAITAEPRWIRAVAFAGAAGLAGFGAVGLALAVAGEYRPSLAFLGGAIVTAAIGWLALPVLRAPGASERAAHAWAAVTLAFVVLLTGWHATHTADHVLINRDPGSYANTGRWIAANGNLETEARVGPFADEPSLSFDSFAVYDTDDGDLVFQFAHLYPAVLAEAHRIGGDNLMFRVPALAGGAALLGFFVLAWRTVRHPAFAFVATVALALTLPQVVFTRDTYSEIPTQVLLFGAAWLLTDWVVGHAVRAAATAGVLLGLLQAVRVDALVFLVALPLVATVLWLRAPSDERVRLATGALACAVGLVPGLVLGFWDLATRSPVYLADLWSEVRSLVLACSASLVVAGLLVLVVPRLPRLPALVLRAASVVAGVVVLVVGLGAWWVRPRVQEMHAARASGLVEGLQQAAGAEIEASRTYFERSLQWMSWYLGPVVVLAGIVGAALLAVALLRGRRLSTLAVLGLVAPASALYLWRASAFPDHLWVMRRFLTSAIPLFVLLAAGLAAWLAARPGPTWRMWCTRLAAVVIGSAAVLHPAVALAPVQAASEQDGFVASVRSGCGLMGRDAAVVVVQAPTGIFHQWVPQALRGWCGVPVAVMRAPGDAAALRRLAASWDAESRALWVVSDDPAALEAMVPGAQVVTTVPVGNEHLLEMTLLSRPDEYRGQALSFALARVPPP